ncbi:MAG: hypothetical protein ABFS41_19440 [Myxococcota bacterium]
MHRTALALLAAFALLGTSACYTARVHSPVPPGVKRQNDHGTIWFWGMMRSETDAVECRAGLADVETSTPWYGYIVAPITLGLAHPVKKSYTCAVGEGF